MNLYVSKLFVFLLLTICRLISGLSPLFASKKFKRKYGLEKDTGTRVERTVSYSMDFSGGILLATCFIHMIPEVRHHLVEILKQDYRFPYAETLVCLGFFIIFVIEESAVQVAQSKSHHLHGTKKTKCGALISPIMVNDTRCIVESDVRDKDKRDLYNDVGGGDSSGNGVSSTITVNNGLILETNPMMKDDANECNNVIKKNKSRNLKNFLLVSMLSFHSVMEGLAIGLAQDTEDVWYLFLAVAFHECTILFCVGIELVVSCSSLATMVTYMTVFALVSPAGVLFGTLFTLNVSDVEPSAFQSVMVSSLQGLAAGTILYVTFFEVLNNHKHHHHHHHRGDTHQSKSGLSKLVFIALGFMFMVVFELIGNHETATSHCYSHEHTTLNNSSI